MFGDSRVLPYAYTYRDYVVRAFNDDVPFDRFVHEQLAADQIEPKVDPQKLAAMGFLTVGRLFDNNIHDVLDDRIDVVTRGLLGLTVSCARCHDHKYDAIPTADYYSLYGIFASSEAPMELPLLEAPEKMSAAAAEFEKKAGPKRQALRNFHEEQYLLLLEVARQRVPDYLVKIATAPADPLETAIFFMSLAHEDLRPPITHRWRVFLERRCRPDDPVFGLWHDLEEGKDEKDFAQHAAKTLERWKTKPAGITAGACNPLILSALSSPPPTGMGDVARRYGNLLVRVYGESKKMPAPTNLAPETKQVLDLILQHDSPCYFPQGTTRTITCRDSRKDAFGSMRVEIDKMAANAPSLRAGRWSWWIRLNFATRTSSCAAIRGSSATRFPGNS